MNLPLPQGSLLVELVPGAWLKPRLVASVKVYALGHPDDPQQKPTVEVRYGGYNLNWGFETAEEAMKFARAVARGVNEQLGGPSNGTIVDTPK